MADLPRPSPTTRRSSPSSAARRRPAIPVEVVSDGFGFFIRPALERLGHRRRCRSSRPDDVRRGRPSRRSPSRTATRRCFVCGTCKRNRVLAHQAAGRAVVFIGDGESDRYAAGYSDVVFAKRALVPICLEAGWPFRRWTEFSEIDAWLEETLEAWRADPASLRRTRRAAVLLRPEVWGDGPDRPAAGRWPPGDRPPSPPLTERRPHDLQALEHRHVGLDESGAKVELRAPAFPPKTLSWTPTQPMLACARPRSRRAPPARIPFGDAPGRRRGRR